jgi:hypothetical protein
MNKNFCISVFIIRRYPSPLLPRVSVRANMSADKCHVEGFLTKNHAGSPFSKDNQRRWFDTTGFTVCYYRDVRTP